MNKGISIQGVPMDLGQNRRGVDMGPSAIRYARGLQRLRALGLDVRDLGDLDVPDRDLSSMEEHELTFLTQVVDVNTRLAQQVSAIVEEGRFPLVWGGDHSITIGVLAGIANHYDNLGVIWYDAHGDLNTAESSPSGNIHGMPLAISLGIGHPQLVGLNGFSPKVKVKNVVHICGREMDQEEKQYIRSSGMKAMTMHEIDRMGMSAVIQEAIDYLAERTDGVHLSLDLDALDPDDAPGVGTPVIGGVTYRESHLAMEMLAEAGFITSADCVEVNPILDHGNKTANAAVALMSSLLGKKVI